MGHSSNPPTTNPTIHITVLTVATLLILTLLILIIGPSRILSDAHSQNTPTCPQQHINLDLPPTLTNQDNHQSQKGNILTPSPYDGTHLRKWTHYPFLTETTLQSPNPLGDSEPQTWESLLSPPTVAGGLRVPAEPLEGSKFDNMPHQHAELGELQDAQVGHVVGMMHQLHCLIMIRSVIFPENNNVEVNSSSKVYGAFEGLKGREEVRGHVSHCFEYLAQVCTLFPSFFCLFLVFVVFEGWLIG